MNDSRELLDSIETKSDLDRLIPFETLCRETYEKGLIRDIPKSNQDFVDTSDMVLLVKKRLFHLGYIVTNDKESKLDETTRQAIKTFQRQAGIKVDGWVGGKTWEVFGELFSFEAESNIIRWMSSDVENPLVHRAVHLRLYAFGLMKKGPVRESVSIESGLKRFVEIAKSLKLSKSTLSPSLELATVELLFNQDSIVKMISELESGHVESLKNSDLVRARSFLVSCAKIELWLLGYNVEPGGKATYIKYKNLSPKKRQRRRNTSGTFYFSLDAFCVSFGIKYGPQRAADYFYRIYSKIYTEFVRMASGEEMSDETDDEVSSKDLYQALSENHVEAQIEWNSQSKSIGGRIVDGLKRAWHWFKRAAKKTISLLGAFVRNVVRLGKKIALDYFDMVRAAIRAFPQSIAFVLNREMPGSDSDSLSLSHDGNFDWTVFVADTATEKSVGAVLGKLDAQVKQLGFCTRIIGIVVTALVSIAKFVVTSYFALVMAIVKTVSGFRELLDYYKANEQELLAR